VGYTKIIQYGDLVEIYNYSKDVHKKKVRAVPRRAKHEYSPFNFRSRASLSRARTAFIRSLEAELSTKGHPTFITLTNYEEVSLKIAYEYLRFFVRNIRERYPNFSFYAVPEWQKTGRIHFHLLAWGLSQEQVKIERNTRFFQRCWLRGFADVLVANDNSNFLALYLAKYITKALSDRRLFNQRAYTHSNNVAKVYKAGSNSLSSYISTFLPDDRILLKEYDYDTQFLGKCVFTQYKVIYDNQSKGSVVR